MKKFSSLEESDKRDLENTLETKASELGLEAWQNYQGGSLLEDHIGLCSKCKCLNYCKTEFGNVHASCSEFDFKLSGQNRITECNLFSAKGSLSLNDMFSIAVLIEPPKRKPGFLG